MTVNFESECDLKMAFDDDNFTEAKAGEADQSRKPRT